MHFQIRNIFTRGGRSHRTMRVKHIVAAVGIMGMTVTVAMQPRVRVLKSRFDRQVEDMQGSRSESVVQDQTEKGTDLLGRNRDRVASGTERHQMIHLQPIGTPLSRNPRYYDKQDSSLNLIQDGQDHTKLSRMPFRKSARTLEDLDQGERIGESGDSTRNSTNGTRSRSELSVRLYVPIEDSDRSSDFDSAGSDLYDSEGSGLSDASSQEGAVPLLEENLMLNGALSDRTLPQTFAQPHLMLKTLQTVKEDEVLHLIEASDSSDSDMQNKVPIMDLSFDVSAYENKIAEMRRKQRKHHQEISKYKKHTQRIEKENISLRKKIAQNSTVREDTIADFKSALRKDFKLIKAWREDKWILTSEVRGTINARARKMRQAASKEKRKAQSGF